MVLLLLLQLLTHARVPTTDPLPVSRYSVPTTFPCQPLPCLHTLEARGVFRAASVPMDRLSSPAETRDGGAEAWAAVEQKLSQLGLLRARLRNTHKDSSTHRSGS